MMKAIYCFLAAGLILLTSLPGSSQNADSLTLKQLNEVVISAPRLPVIPEMLPEAYRQFVISPDELMVGRSIPELLMPSSGIFIQKTNHGGGSPFIRGLTGNQLLYLFDGIRLSNATVRYGPNQLLNTVDMFGTGRIEVLHGSGSVQYGSDALGGTLHILSHETPFTTASAFGGQVTLRAMSGNMEQSGNVRVRFSSPEVSMSAGITRRHFGDLYGGDTTGKQSPSGYEELDTDLKLRFKTGTRSGLTFFWQRNHQTDVDIYHKVALENYAINRVSLQQRDLGYLRYTAATGNPWLSQWVITASYQQSPEERETQKNGSDVVRSERDEVNTTGLSAEVRSSVSLGKGRLQGTSGIEFYYDKIYSERKDSDANTGETVHKRGLYPDGSGLKAFALFSGFSYETRHWVIQPGLRFSAHTAEIKDNALGSISLVQQALVGNIGVTRKTGRHTGVFAGIGRGFRAPNLDDLGTLGIMDFRYEVPNYDLKPEKLLQSQAGFRFSGTKTQAEAYVYYNSLNNLIVREKQGNDSIEGYPVYVKSNVEEAYVYGLESFVNQVIGSNLKAKVMVTYTYGQNLTRKEPVRRIPPLFGSLSLEGRHLRLLYGAEWLWASAQKRLAAGDRSDNRIPEGGTPGWNVINLYAAYKVKFLQARLTLNNIGNADYRYHGSGINGTGRSLTAGLTLRF